jgi:hypothetical protein
VIATAELLGASQLRSTEYVVAASPVPLNATVDVLVGVELLLTVSCPVAAPAALGRYWMVTDAVAPGLREIGKLPPTIEKPVPVTVTEETVTADVPVDVSVTDSVVEDPTVTVPKLKLVALRVSFGLVAADPVPVRVTPEVAPVVELLLIVNWPVTAPAAVGANLI